ncbi:MAG: phytoene synthase [Isosphaeraceae bacterium]|jgi:phytoene synthase|nr:MAG: phytoene synthase [Isosphaeraceae bacterium]
MGGDEARDGDPDAVRAGDAICRETTRTYARTFYFASHLLPASVRRHAYAVYGFCRWADNLVDDAANVAEASQRLAQARTILDRAYGAGPGPPALIAFRRTTQARAIPKELFSELLDGMEMDLTTSRYATFADLDRYCYRVAGVVGLMMTHVFGYRDERCFAQAIALGRAMQLTNILRDIREDLERGRVYVPQDELARFGVTEAQLRRGQVDDRFRALMRFQIARARAAYAEADTGIPEIKGRTCRLTVRAMARLYAGILDAIEASDFDVFTRRAAVSTAGKLARLVACFRDEWSR